MMNFGQVRNGIRRLFRVRVHHERLARADAEEELRAYVAARVEQLTATGLSPTEAHAEAIRRLGGSYARALDDAVRSARHREKAMRLRDCFDEMKDDLRFAVRGLRREKSFTTFIVGTLALGIGANAAMYGVIDRLLIRGPEHVVDADRVMRAYWTAHVEPRGDVTTPFFGWVTYDLFRKQAKSFGGVAAYEVYSPGTQYGNGADAVLVPFGAATWDLFPTLGVRPAVGRFFNPQEDSPDAPQPVTVLGYGLWQRAFGHDPGVVGRAITLGSVKYTIVGVAPAGFTGPDLGPVDAWIPMSLHSRNVTNDWTHAWNAQWLRIVARLKPGVTPEQAATEASAVYHANYTGNEAPAKVARIFFAQLGSNGKGDESSEARISRWLVGVTLVVLLIACANIANLLLARAVRRRREVAVRIALGAGRGRLLRLLLTESALLAFAGAVAGLAVAWGTALLMRNVLLPGVEWPSSPVDTQVLAVSLLLASIVGVLTGLVPAFRASRPDLTASLKAGAREGGGQTARFRGALTVIQAALSIVLLAGAGLFVRSLMHVRALDLGIEPDRVLVVQVRYPSNASAGNAQAAGEAARRTQVLRDAVLRARALPNVENASLTIGLPFQSSFGLLQRVVGWDSIPHLKGGDVDISAVADGYFATVGTHVLDGRPFETSDRDGSEPVAIVNHTMATTLWPGRSPIGECLYWGVTPDSLTTCSRIVGVVADAHSFALREDPHMHYYVPFGQERAIGGTNLLVRPKPGAEADVMAAMRTLLAGLDPSISFVQTQMLQDAVDPQVRPWRLGAAMFSLLGVLALIVAAVGLYSVMSYLVAQRTREIGVRIALGAQASSIMRLILRNGIALAGIGITIGVAVVLGAGRFIAPLLFETSPRDPLVLGIIVLALLGVAVAASVVPALRARRVDPMEALRAE